MSLKFVPWDWKYSSTLDNGLEPSRPYNSWIMMKHCISLPIIHAYIYICYVYKNSIYARFVHYDINMVCRHSTLASKLNTVKRYCSFTQLKYHIEAGARWPLFSRRHFEMDLIEWKFLNFDIHHEKNKIINYFYFVSIRSRFECNMTYILLSRME